MAQWTPYKHSPEAEEDSDSVPWTIHLPLGSEENSKPRSNEPEEQEAVPPEEPQTT